jgi:hypothetical protein
MVKGLIKTLVLRFHSLSRTKGSILARFLILEIRTPVGYGLGARLAGLALAFNLLGPFALPVAPGAAFGHGETAVICTARGIETVARDFGDRPRSPAPRPHIQCLFCLPLLKQGAAAPVAAPAIIPVVAEPLAVELPAAADRPRRVQARLIAAPRAPPDA